MPQQVEVTITVNGTDHKLSGIPLEAWEAFKQQSKIHFPDAKDDAWANFISEIIVAAVSHESYILTDIPPNNSKAMDTILSQVNWTQEQFHVYLLKSALIKDALRIISFHDKKQEFGTLVVTGIRPSTFEKIEKVTGVNVENFFGILIDGLENGDVQFTPNEAFATIKAARH